MFSRAKQYFQEGYLYVSEKNAKAGCGNGSLSSFRFGVKDLWSRVHQAAPEAQTYRARPGSRPDTVAEEWQPPACVLIAEGHEREMRYRSDTCHRKRRTNSWLIVHFLQLWPVLSGQQYLSFPLKCPCHGKPQTVASPVLPL